MLSVVVATAAPTDDELRLRRLIKHRGGSDLTFREVTDIAARLNDGQLTKLANEVGVGRTDGMRGWVRSAVFAEWGRRDFDAAMKHLSGVSHLDSGQQQALYAVFRGSRPKDPLPALFHLQRMFTDHPSAVGAFTRIWAQRALKEVFADLAAQKPQRAWELLTSDFEQGRERMALEFLSKKFSRHPLRNIESEWIALSGFFLGLQDRATVMEYAARFQVAWNTPEVAADLQRFNQQSRSRTGSMSWTPPPPHEGVARAIAVSIARFDLAAAVGWIVKSGPGTEQQKRGRASGLFTDWAWKNPQAAWAEIRQGNFVKWHEEIATALLRGDATLAPELARLKGSAGWFRQAMSMSFAAAATMMEYDLFPVPERPNILASHQERYESFREATKIAGVSGSRLKQLHRSLNSAFQYTVPAAKQALESGK